MSFDCHKYEKSTHESEYDIKDIRGKSYFRLWENMCSFGWANKMDGASSIVLGFERRFGSLGTLYINYNLQRPRGGDRDWLKIFIQNEM